MLASSHNSLLCEKSQTEAEPLFRFLTTALRRERAVPTASSPWEWRDTCRNIREVCKDRAQT